MVLSEGSYIVRLIRQGHFKLALAEIAAENRFWGGSLALSLLRYTRTAVVPEAVKKRLRRVRDRHYVKGCIKSSLERYGRIAAAAGTEGRDPFRDKRVVDYCTRLPGRLRLKNGLPKIMLREIMADKLPDETLWCPRNPHLGWLFNAAVSKEALSRRELDITTLQEDLRGYVDPGALSRSWETFRDGGDAETTHSAYILSVWLRENANRPVVPD